MTTGSGYLTALVVAESTAHSTCVHLLVEPVRRGRMPPTAGGRLDLAGIRAVHAWLQARRIERIELFHANAPINRDVRRPERWPIGHLGPLQDRAVDIDAGHQRG